MENTKITKKQAYTAAATFCFEGSVAYLAAYALTHKRRWLTLAAVCAPMALYCISVAEKERKKEQELRKEKL